MKESGIPEPAVAYLRVSDKKQLNTAVDIDPDGNSIATQRTVVEQRADSLPASIVKEFVEPGISAQTIEKRPAFQEMIAYLQENPRIKYVIVYARSRAFRNYIDAAVTKRQLDNMGVKLISAREDFGEGIYADMMAAITDIFNDTQNKLSGQDISIKMLNKAMNGGTCSRAKLGYVNARISFEGRPVNTIKIDEERAPLVVRAWELYATGTYTIDELEAAMADLGLTSRPTSRCPGRRPVSAATLHNMLRDPYYVGYVIWKEADVSRAP
ncbi:recombinase family protein [Nocardia sp. NPDC050175]|uniref:recombinase family protein n=1 Tax=Nocardia sp. NPDC050175 TaxID=3364317 RepID=UPI003796EEAF